MKNTLIEYKPIPGFDNYAISRDGEVKNIKTSKTLKSNINQGYLQICLTQNGKEYTKKIHQLVALAYIGERPNGMQVCHNDGIKTNNDYTNLRYATCKENAQDKIIHGTTAKGLNNGAYTKPECRPSCENHGRAKLSNEIVRRIKSDLANDTLRGRLKRAAIKYGTSIYTVYLINKNKIWKGVV